MVQREHMERRDQEDNELRILTHLGNRGARPEDLPGALNLSAGEIASAVEALQKQGWVTRGAAGWYAETERATELLLLLPAGTAELNRREELEAVPADEPVELTRDELILELERRGYPPEQVQLDPSLRRARFWFWPSIPAYSSIQSRVSSTWHGPVLDPPPRP